MTMGAAANRTEIPWQDEASWQELRAAISAICSGLGERESEIREIAVRIKAGYLHLDGPSERLCRLTCGSCREVCCLQATLWYDLADLLFIQLIDGDLPANQIFRSSGGACCNLGTLGCRLPRWRRPFICSWYLCAAQLTELHQSPQFQKLKEQIEELRVLRKNLVASCVAAVAP